jgi:pimeloyl-ACP methyl ester carboxylesterase
MSLWTDFSGASFSNLQVAGVKTRVLRMGPDSGRPVVLLHGRGGHLETFQKNVRAWASHRAVIAFDLLGHGMTAQGGQLYDIGELRSHAEAVIDSVAGQDYDLVGQSLGGWIATLIALDNPLVRRLVLIEPAGFQTEEQRMSDPAVRGAAERGGRAFDTPTPADVALRFAQLLLDEKSIDPEMVELRTRFYRLPGAGEVHKAVRTANNSRWILTDARMTDLRADVLIVRGEHGHIPRAVLTAVALRAGGELVTVPQAKQWPHYENPAVVNTAIGDFIKERAA